MEDHPDESERAPPLIHFSASELARGFRQPETFVFSHFASLECARKVRIRSGRPVTSDTVTGKSSTLRQ